MGAMTDALRHQKRAKQRQRAQLIAFEHQYEGLVDLLCASAREGIHEDRESEYRRRRDWMMIHYPPVAKHLHSYWAANQQEAMDPFMALFCPPNLEDTINIETTIEDIVRCRMALEAYAGSIVGCTE